jgi:hypothetical protein
MELPNKSFSLLREWSRFSRAIETTLIDNIASMAPWLAPVIPAYMAWHSMITSLLFPPMIAFAGALVVEFLGLSAVSTTFTFWDYNDSKRKTDQGAPVAVALITSIFYLAVILLVNVVLDNSPFVERLAKGLLSSLSVVAAVILALRSQHSRRLQAIEQEKTDRKELRLTRKDPASLPEISGKLPHGADWRKLTAEERGKVHQMTVQQIVAKYHVSERTARNWRASNDT